MKKGLFILFVIFQIGICAQTQAADEVPQTYTAAQQMRDVFVFAEKNKFGLKDNQGNIIAPAKFQKIVMTGRNGWIVQKRNKYGLMNSRGEYLIKPEYRYADRIFGRYIKFGNDHDFGIYNEFGETILPPDYRAIELLYGRMFLTYKNFRYGVTDFKGNILIPNVCEEIYMPSTDVMKIKYLGEWYELDNINTEGISIAKITEQGDTVKELNFRNLIADTGAISGYSVLTFSDYLIKVFSSISPAHEETIDDLILSHGVDTVGILKKFSWVPKYPLTFGKNYLDNLRNPYNGLLSDTRNKLINKR